MLQLIDQHDATIVLLGSKRQHTDGEAILRNLGNAARNVVNLIGMLTLAELPGVVHQFDLYVGPDTGTTHLAALLGRKTLCLHAGVSPIESFGPIGPNAVVVKCVNLPCAPCGIQELSGCAHNHRCMRSITAETITHEIEEMLASEEVRAAGSFASFGG